MKLQLIVAVSVLSIFFGVFIVTAQQDEQVRGAFLDSRPKTTNPNAPPRSNRRRPSNANVNSSAGVKVKTNANANAGAKKVYAAIGLGYTMFMRESAGRSIRVDPAREFHTGDRIRLALEPSVDGYLYIFDSEEGGVPKMIYPDVRLNGGDNWIEAHVPVEIPSSEEPDERLRWFEFYGQPGSDRLYIVLTREPLPLVPTGDALVAFCGAKGNTCPWQPPADAWAQIDTARTAPVRVATTDNFGQAQTQHEQVATTRGLGLDQSVPPPSVIRMNASTSAPILVTVLDLIHK
jgi:uncharacterized protein DUF4384